jgi:hypothetical protein
MRNKVLLAILLACAAGLSSVGVWADEDEDQAAVTKLLPAAKITLQQGLTMSESKGKPISGKFEVDEGHFQLSVYTANAGKFFEVAIDPATGKIVKTEPIAEGEDFAAATSQAAAMARVKTPLKAAVDTAQHTLVAGFRAVSVTPNLKQEHATAVVVLLNGVQFKSVSEPLE